MQSPSKERYEMSGNRYMLDNAVVALLQGNTQLVHRLQNADWIGISVISQSEFLVFSGLTDIVSLSIGCV
jgi:tRNA(fMet)-specific endonuclease VapC